MLIPSTSTLHHHRKDHRPALGSFPKEPSELGLNLLLDEPPVGDFLGRRAFHGGNDQNPELLQQLLVLQEAAGNDLGRGLHATVLLVDGDDRRWVRFRKNRLSSV